MPTAPSRRRGATRRGARNEPRARRRGARSRIAPSRHCGSANAHRGWKRQPVGSIPGCGGDPGIVGRRCPLRSGCGAALINARVYGCSGRANIAAVSATSITWPPYMMTIREARPASRPRSWVTNNTAMPNSCCSSLISSVICACTVTSRAVVGSSAISSFGRHTSAVAIITRCCMPPENWKEYCFAREAGSGMPTLRSMSTARASAARRETGSWARTTSAICSPTVHDGCRLDIGSWNTMPRSRPRRSRSSFFERVSRSSPSNRMRPLTRWLRPGSRPMIASAVIVLPEPLSPARPSTSPAPISKLTSSRIDTHPRSAGRSTDRCSICSNVFIAPVRGHRASRRR